MITVSAPGKVHFIGEHAVVHGYPAIIAAVGKRVYVEAERSDKVSFKHESFNRYKEWTREEAMESVSKAQELWQKCAEKKDFTELLSWAKDGGTYNTYWKALIGTVLKMTGADRGISISITRCDIPIGSGLGSSSAVAVAVAKAVSEVYGKGLGLEEINNIAFECEKLVHGTPSGGDNTACCYGGLVWFQKSAPKNIIKPLGDEIPHKLENFVIAYTKQPEKSTGELVQMVRNIPEEERKPKMDELGQMTEELKEVLKQKNYTRMKAIMNRTNEILSSFGLSIPETESISRKVALLGGAAKMCGACYGGVMLTWHDYPEQVVSAIKQLGFEPIQTELAVEGVRVEK